jgi:antitoxin (DNA-binding transcriptional repressor) of toxin-antitoxin stability system
MNQQVRVDLPGSVAAVVERAVASGAEVVLVSGGVAIARAEPIAPKDPMTERSAAVERLLARSSAMPKITSEEILEWIAEGRR